MSEIFPLSNTQCIRWLGYNHDVYMILACIKGGHDLTMHNCDHEHQGKQRSGAGELQYQVYW